MGESHEIKTGTQTKAFCMHNANYFKSHMYGRLCNLRHVLKLFHRLILLHVDWGPGQGQSGLVSEG